MGEIFVHEGPRPEMQNTGERLTVGHMLETELEHYHRYYLARDFVRGRDVLEIASGEGYGAALLAQVARSVHGVDVSEQAVAHARTAHPAPNLTFTQGDACRIPLADASVDVVTSFETLEHFYDHDGFFAELKRILRPGGLVLMSTPNRDVYSPPDAGANPYHVRELTRDEFDRKCREYFANVALFSQFAMVGTAILADQPQPEPMTLFERRGERNIEASQGVYRAKFCLCLASDAALPRAANSLLVHSYAIDGLTPEHIAVAQRDAMILARDAIIADRDKRVRDQDAQLHQRGRAITRLGRLLAERDRQLLDLRAAHGQLEGMWRQLLNESRELEAALTAARAKAIEVQAALDRMRADYLNVPISKGMRAVLRKLRQRYRWVRDVPRLRRASGVVRRSKLFQAEWYLARYADVRLSGIDPAQHYARFGALEGRNPGPDFDSLAYLSQYPDVRVAGMNPLVHFELSGRAEGRRSFAIGELDLPPASTPADEAAPGLDLPMPDTAPVRRIIYVSGEPHTPGHSYRVERYAAAAQRCGAEVTRLRIEQLGRSHDRIAECDLLIIWRADMTAELRAAIAAARAAGAKVQFDVDDLMFEPEIARVETIDGIRSQGFSESGTAELFGRIAEVVMAADYCSAPTEYLAGRLQRFAKPTFVLPNGFDETVWRLARLAFRERAMATPDGLVRIGYAAGSKTHQKDFAVAAAAVGRVLRARPEVRLVLFHLNRDKCLVVEEFAELKDVQHQIEWREMVPVERLPAEMARFDISIAPLQLGNPFCEAKSELKFFEAALVEVPVVATPTAVFRRAIQPGQNGFLANGEAEWEAALTQLVDDAALRRRIGRAAYYAVQWPFGPDARVDRMRSVLAQQGSDPAEAARSFELELGRQDGKRQGPPDVRPHAAEVIQDRLEAAEVTVVVPLYNYENFIVEALESVRAQSLERIDLVVVNDGSTDNSAAVAREWMMAAKSRFNRLVFVNNEKNVGLGLSRNIGFANAETPFVIQLDADNKLLPEFAARCLAMARQSGAAFVYPIIRMFDEEDGLMGTASYDAQKLATGNYIDAMALVRVAAWAEVGGYDHVRFGWEDYDLWCRFAERGWFGQQVPELLAMYRVHGKSMLRTQTDVLGNKRSLIEDMRRRHPWAVAGSALDLG